jgi:predicted O-methyltransferase YrrM
LLTLPGLEPPPPKTDISRKVSFLQPYVTALLGSILLFLGGWVTWKGRAIIVDLCRQFGYDYVSQEKTELPRVSIEALTPNTTKVELWALDGVDGNVTDRELLTIARLVSAAGAKRIFEFGTFDGRTTLNMAMNAGDGAAVFTLDLPASATASTSAPLHPHETQYAIKETSGARYRGTPAASRITQLFGDSATFDHSEFAESMDVVFVDGSHAYKYVVNDSLRALAMTKGGGTILWHDYGRWDDVTKALNDLRRRSPDFAGLSWIEGTTLAVLRRG